MGFGRVGALRWRALHRSFRTRLSVLVAVAVGVAIALAAVGSYVAVSRQLYGNVNRTLTADLTSCTGGGFFDQNGILQVVRSGDQIGLFAASGAPLYLGPFGTVAQTSLHPTSQMMALAGAGRHLFVDTTSGGVAYRVLATGVSVANGPAGPTTNAVFLVAQPLTATDHTLAQLQVLLALVGLLGIALAVALGSAIAAATIRPVQRLTAAAEHVAATQDLDASIEVDSDDELGRLAGAFNAMLAALRRSRQQQAQLVSDAGHELRTPLTSLRTNVEFLMRAGELPPGDRQELLDDVHDQLEELTALVGDIVETARQDERQVEPIEARLDAIVGRAIERARRRAPSLHFEADLDAGAVRATPALLERAVLNVLDNAAKWSPSGGTVEVTLTRGGCWSLEVRDHGPGIDPADLPHVMERFYRAETARSMPGSGLGLAIVSQVVADHGGSVTLSAPAGGGTLARIELPTVEEDEPALQPAFHPPGGADGWGPPIAPDRTPGPESLHPNP